MRTRAELIRAFSASPLCIGIPGAMPQADSDVTPLVPTRTVPQKRRTIIAASPLIRHSSFELRRLAHHEADTNQNLRCYKCE